MSETWLLSSNIENVILMVNVMHENNKDYSAVLNKFKNSELMKLLEKNNMAYLVFYGISFYNITAENFTGIVENEKYHSTVLKFSKNGENICKVLESLKNCYSNGDMIIFNGQLKTYNNGEFVV